MIVAVNGVRKYFEKCYILHYISVDMFCTKETKKLIHTYLT